MKMPGKPPDIENIPQGWSLVEKTVRLHRILKGDIHASVRGRYVHWDKLKCYSPPDGFSHEDWWYAIKIARLRQAKRIPLSDVKGRRFIYVLADSIPEVLHEIDQGAGGYIRMPEPITNPDTRDQYYVSSLVQEAITSSQLEGAVTTRVVAKEMIRTGHPP